MRISTSYKLAHFLGSICLLLSSAPIMAQESIQFKSEAERFRMESRPKPCTGKTKRLFLNEAISKDSVNLFTRKLTSQLNDSIFGILNESITPPTEISKNKFFIGAFRLRDSPSANAAKKLIPGSEISFADDYHKSTPFEVQVPGTIDSSRLQQLKKILDSAKLKAKADFTPNEVYIAIGKCIDQQSADNKKATLQRKGISTIYLNISPAETDL